MVLVYLVKRFFWRLENFFHNWYVHGSRRLAHYFISALEAMDRSLAVKITLQHFFEPLYKDYTVIGRILGFFFRLGRLTIGILVYSVFGLAALGIYLGWLMLPALVLYGIFRNLFAKINARN